MNSARPCPVCGEEKNRRLLHRQRFAGGGLLGDGYDVVICGICGTGFADGIPSQRELDRYYAECSKYEYAHAGGAESPYDLRRFETIAEQIALRVPDRNAAILDVGCATGGLLACLARRGYTRVTGSDPSPACAAAAKRLYGIEVSTGTIAGLAGEQRRFDLVLAVGVLEHLRDVRAALTIMANLLTPEGCFYCAQPDVESFAESINAPYQQFSVEHVNYFSTNTLNRLLRTSGLGPLQTWRWLVEWREGVTDSVVSGIYGRIRNDRPAVTADFDATTEPALRRYLGQCETREKRLRELLAGVALTQEPIIVWGAGSLTRRLLADGGLDAANILCFVDSNGALHGTRLNGRRILAPADLRGRGERILICSTAFSREIERLIRGELGLSNGLILLHEDLPQGRVGAT